MQHRRTRLTFANVVSVIALFVAMGGTSFAAVALSRNSVRSAHIKNGQVKRADLARNAVTSHKVAVYETTSEQNHDGLIVCPINQPCLSGKPVDRRGALLTINSKAAGDFRSAGTWAVTAP